MGLDRRSVSDHGQQNFHHFFRCSDYRLIDCVMNNFQRVPACFQLGCLPFKLHHLLASTSGRSLRQKKWKGTPSWLLTLLGNHTQSSLSVPATGVATLKATSETEHSLAGKPADIMDLFSFPSRFYHKHTLILIITEKTKIKANSHLIRRKSFRFKFEPNYH